MERLKSAKYIQTSVKKFDPLALALSVVGLGAVVSSIGTAAGYQYLFDLRSVLVVGAGTLASLLFQFDFSMLWLSSKLLLRSLRGTPDMALRQVLAQLDQAILEEQTLDSLADGFEINGEWLNDLVFMKKSGLFFEEINELITARVADEFKMRELAQAVLSRAAITAPALGLFGTVIGLIGVLRSMQDPSQIGPSMSLALMTTAYGAGLGSLVFSPLAGRLEHHNEIFLEVHHQLLSKLRICMTRDERQLDGDHWRYQQES